MSAANIGIAIAGAAASSLVSSALSSNGSSNSGASQADPFASQRGQYQAQLQQLMTNPSSITSTPGYQYTLQQGTNTVNQGAAASGMLNSGNRLIALQNLGQQSAETEYNNQFTMLAQLAGANVGSPGEAGQLTAANSANNSLAASSIGNAVSSALTNGLSSTSGNNTTNDPSYAALDNTTTSSSTDGSIWSSGVGDSSSYSFSL